MLKLILKITCFFCLILFVSCSNENNINLHEVIISGKINNLNDKERQIKLNINKLALRQETIIVNIDSSGFFKTSFNIYIPSDVLFEFNKTFSIITHPGDSIHIEFEDKRNNFLQTIRFSGSAAKTNQDALAFQQIYSQKFYDSHENKIEIMKNYESEEFLNYLDIEKAKWNKYYNEFVNNYSPNDETKNWVSMLINSFLIYDLFNYPLNHQHFNNLSKKEWDVPLEYYDKFKGFLPLKKEMLISTDAMNTFINYYHYGYAFNNFLEDYFKSGSAEDKNIDSLYFFCNIKYSEDPLMQQFILTEFLVEKLETSDIIFFEEYKNTISSYITEPYLREPLFELYKKVYDNIKNPEIATDAILKKLDGSVKKIIDNIILQNEEKVIYIDCWGTWCAPCIHEMPSSKNLMSELKDKDVAFVFICIDSDEKNWKASLSEMKIGGQHYFLNKEESIEFRNAFEVHGIPHYFLLNKKGIIVERGFHLGPDSAKEKIEKLL